TKYLNGHSDIVAGAVVGRADLVEKVRHKLNHLGGSLDPHACFLLHRGMKTLALRVRHQNESASRIAGFLETAPGVTKVNYPGLASHPRHARARELFAGCGGVLSFELDGGEEAAARFIERTEIPRKTVSLGGVESLITRPALSSHAGVDPEDRRRLGITDSLVRLAVGIEAADDLIEDLDRALRG
ncbi:MAG TPA: PLP-dependent transferase, partial [Thermoanaerobaculia bacterium]|nr:PLP-dependent transferase [Thermoanaerobaculia bacterium]